MDYLKDLNIIKDKFGEDMMRFCRKSFSPILEIQGLLPLLLTTSFDCSRNLYVDIMDNCLEEQFKNYVYSQFEQKYDRFHSDKTPEQLLDEKGYTLYQCHTEEEIQSFKKYYQKGEELCTFLGGKLNKRYVFFIVSKDIENIKRPEKPSREDKYSRSVLSIQFDKGYHNYTSIISRYNYRVNNPDATFSGNLDYITPGLRDSFEKYYGFNLSYPKDTKLYLPNYVKAEDGKMYKYNYEINNIYYCPNNIIIDNGKVLTDYNENERYIIFDYFILDLKEKKISLYDQSINDTFIKGIEDIKRITVRRDKKRQTKIISIKPIIGEEIIIILDKFNNMIEYHNDNIYEIEDNFLVQETTLKSISMDNARSIGNDFLPINNKVDEIYFPNVLRIKDRFLYSNNKVKRVSLPRVVIIGDDCLYWNRDSLEILEANNLEQVGDNLLLYNTSLKLAFLDKVSVLGDNALKHNTVLESLNSSNMYNIRITYNEDGKDKVLSLK